MIRSPRIDWRTCWLQAAWFAAAYTVYSSMEIIRVAGDGGTLGQSLAVWAVSLALALVMSVVQGLGIAAGTQWTYALPRHGLWSGALIVLALALSHAQLNTITLHAASHLILPTVLEAAAPNPFTFWRAIVGGTLFFGYCRLVQHSREQQDQLARAALVRAATEVRLREARARTLEHCVDPVLLERTIAALRTAYARDRAAGESLLDAMVDFLRLAMPAVRAGATLETDRATLWAWQRLHDQLENEPPAPDHGRQGEM
jgi:hypothetical protein